MLTPERLAEITARHAATLDADWHNEWTHADICDPDNDWYEVDGPDYDRDRETPYFTEPHAAFIAHAHQDIPDLLAEVERLQAHIDTLQELRQLDTARVAKLEHWHDDTPRGIPPGGRQA